MGEATQKELQTISEGTLLDSVMGEPTVQVPTCTPSEALMMAASNKEPQNLSGDALLDSVVGKTIDDDEPSDSFDAEAQLALASEHLEDEKLTADSVSDNC